MNGSDNERVAALEARVLANEHYTESVMQSMEWASVTSPGRRRPDPPPTRAVGQGWKEEP
jgi:hypothetical protein